MKRERRTKLTALYLTFTPETRIHVRYTIAGAKDGPNPGTQARKREVQEQAEEPYREDRNRKDWRNGEKDQAQGEENRQRAVPAGREPAGEGGRRHGEVRRQDEEPAPSHKGSRPWRLAVRRRQEVANRTRPEGR